MNTKTSAVAAGLPVATISFHPNVKEGLLAVRRSATLMKGRPLEVPHSEGCVIRARELMAFSTLP